MARLDWAKCSSSLASRRQRPVHAMLRSTTHRRGSGTKPRWSGARVTISNSTPYARCSHSSSPRYPWSAHSFRSCGPCGSRRASSSRAPCCSDQSAPTTSAPSSRPCVSTTRNRLRPVILFPPVEAALSAGFSRLHRLTVDHPRARLLRPARRAAVLGAQGGVDPLPGPGPQPQIVVVAYAVRVGELVGQQAPLAAGPQQVPQRVHHLPQFQRAGPPGPGRAGQQRLQQRPLGIGQIGRIGPARSSTRHSSCTSGWSTLPGANPVPSPSSLPYSLFKRPLSSVGENLMAQPTPKRFSLVPIYLFP